MRNVSDQALMGPDQTFDAFCHTVHIPAQVGNLIPAMYQTFPDTGGEIASGQLLGDLAQAAQRLC